MLVLSRKVKQQIVIGEEICVTVIAISRNQVRLGVEAPRRFRVYRQEIAPKAPAPVRQLTLPFAGES